MDRDRHEVEIAPHALHEVVGEAGNARDAVFRARALTPDVILLDMVMPGESGLEGVPKLLHEHPDVKIVTFTGSKETGIHVARTGADTFEIAVMRSFAGTVFEEMMAKLKQANRELEDQIAQQAGG